MTRSSLDSHKSCAECEALLPVSEFSPRTCSPNGRVERWASFCRPCLNLRRTWLRERERRMKWLEAHGLGPSAYKGRHEENQFNSKERVPVPPLGGSLPFKSIDHCRPQSD